MAEEKRFQIAREGYEKRNVEISKKAHTEKEIKKHLEKHKTESGQYLEDLVYGALDGVVTTFAVVSGVAGAKLSVAVVIILGFANLLGDGISMALGNYISSKSQKEFIKKERKREEWEVENTPKGEIAEIRAIYHRKGFRGKKLDSITKLVTGDKKVWVDTMMIEELGLLEDEKSPSKAGFATFIAFAVAGFIPLLAFVLSYIFPSISAMSFTISIVLSFITLFIVGSLRSFLITKSWWKAGLEMLLVGGIAAGAAYLVGFLLRGLV
ncbi:VIT1/CCC1 transporter family protein [Nanoarchaeota archaeon]